MGHKRPKIMFHSLKLLSQLRHPEPRRGEGSHFDEILRSGFPWKIPFQRKPESSLLGRPFGPQNDKINFMSPTEPIDGIMLSKLDTHDLKWNLPRKAGSGIQNFLRTGFPLSRG